ncbi:hypothetical protein Tco_0649596, partial [Tanacetum coccineum]
MCTYLKNMEGYKLNDLKLKDFDFIQEMFDIAFKRVNTLEDFRTELVEGKEKRTGAELVQESIKKQKVEDDKETTELKKLIEIILDEEEVAIDASKPLEDLEGLYKLVKAKFKSTKPVEDLALLLWGDLKTMFEPHVEDAQIRRIFLEGYGILVFRIVIFKGIEIDSGCKFHNKAEYVAASSCCGQVLWIQNQLLDYGSKTTAWNEFSSTMASAIICLATTQKFNFSEYIFESMIRNLDNVSGKFLMYPSLVRATTTASSLEAEQDSGNLTKTRSKVTPNGSSSLGTTSGGGPRCQKTMGDTIAQTRFENVSKHSNDSLLARGNTLQSDEDSLKLNELMELCTNLQTRVLDLEKKNTTQQNEIDTRVESSSDEEDLGEDASKQGRRINVIDADEDITLVNVQDDADNEMFDV